jgi:CRISPR-associated protein Csm1
MSLQVFLQAQIFGTEQFLSVETTEPNGDLVDFVGRCAWLSLLCEVLPRALLSELRLSRMLLGSSSAEQFFLVLAEETIPQANEFLSKAAAAIAQLSGNTLRLVWASTENLGAWPIARKRLDDALQAKVSAPLSHVAALADVFAPFENTAVEAQNSYFAEFGKQLPAAKRVGWSALNPAQLTWDAGDFSWALQEQSAIDDDGILFPRRAALDDDGTHPASLPQLAGRAEGAAKWGILRGDVDHFEAHLRRLGTIEEHIHLSALFKEFFAGELALLCTLPDFWRKVSILYRGGDDFAVTGTWDALVLLARELQRLFEKFIEHNTEAFPGLEGRTLSMALAICPDLHVPVAAVFQEAGQQLRAAKSTDSGSFHLFGRTLEWKRLSDAEELKAGLVRLVRDYRFPADYINDLASVYREAFSARAGKRGKAVRIDKPWRTYMRLASVIPQGRGKELNNVRNAVITNLVGKRTAGLKLRPSARVGLEWARLAAGNQA